MANLNPLSWLGLTNIKPEPVKPFKEQGVSNFQVYAGFLATPEKSPKLQGSQKYLLYNDISSNIPIIAASIRFQMNLLGKAKWTVVPVDDTPEAQRYADFVYRTMESLDSSWERVIRRAAGFKLCGVSISEWTAQKDADGLITYRSVEARDPGSITQWDISENGDVNGFVQHSPTTQLEVFLPRQKVIYLTDDLLSGSPQGLGLLRHCVEPADRLAQLQILERRGFERDLRGTPVARAPYQALEEWAAGDPEREAVARGYLSNIEKFVSMQLKGSDTGVILDSATFTSQSDTGKSVSSVPQWDVELLQGGSTGLGEVASSITRLNMEIARIFSTEGLLLGQESSSQALSKDKSNNLFMSINSTLTDMKAAFNKDYLGPLWDLNGFPVDMMPSFAVEDVAARTAEEIAETLANLSRAALSPDDEAIDYVRGMMGVPEAPDPTESLL